MFLARDCGSVVDPRWTERTRRKDAVIWQRQKQHLLGSTCVDFGTGPRSGLCSPTEALSLSGRPPPPSPPGCHGSFLLTPPLTALSSQQPPHPTSHRALYEAVKLLYITSVLAKTTPRYPTTRLQHTHTYKHPTLVAHQPLEVDDRRSAFQELVDTGSSGWGLVIAHRWADLDGMRGLGVPPSQVESLKREKGLSLGVKDLWQQHFGTFVCKMDYLLIYDTNSIGTYTDVQFQEKNRT